MYLHYGIKLSQGIHVQSGQNKAVPDHLELQVFGTMPHCADCTRNFSVCRQVLALAASADHEGFAESRVFVGSCTLGGEVQWSGQRGTSSGGQGAKEKGKRFIRRTNGQSGKANLI